MSRLSGKTAVITGGGSGMRLGAARQLVEEGAFIYIFGRRRAALDAALAELGPNARAVRGSVTEAADLDRLYEAVKAERGGLDIVFANEAEVTALFQTQDFDAAVKALAARSQIAAVTRSEKGSVIVSGEAWHEIWAAAVDKVVDTTGAGDCFRGSFVGAYYGDGKSLEEAMRWAAAAGTLSVQVEGAMPSMPPRAKIEAQCGEALVPA